MRVGVEDVGPLVSEYPSQPRHGGEVECTAEDEDPRVEAFGRDALDERAGARRDERDVVARSSCGAGEPQRNELPARDVPAYHEVDDLHGRRGCLHTATSSAARSTSSRSI